MSSILRKEQRRALQFVQECNDSGYLPTPMELSRWLSTPEGRPPSFLAARFSPQFNPFSRWEPDSHPEIDLLLELGWAQGQRRLRITNLGSALLRSALNQKASSSTAVFIGASDDDPLAYPGLIGHIAAMGACMLVDPYLRMDALHDIASSTKATRILVKSGYRGSERHLPSMATYLKALPADRDLEVRSTDDARLHDRFVVNSESLTMFGRSINGLHSGGTLLVDVPEPAAGAQRDLLEALWVKGEPLAPAPQDDIEQASPNQSEAD